MRRVKPPWVEIAILILAAVLRLWTLDLKPAHFDEGVNGWFADQMTAEGLYRYDPTNYHGPLHFYAVFVSQTLFGRNLWSLRLPAVVASLLAVWALLRFREFFGITAARMAALAMAVSPAFVYFGRYSIHESWLVFFLLLTLFGLLGLWEKGEKRFLWTLAIGITGMVLTKETYAIHLAAFALAAPVLWLWQKVVPSHPSVPLALRHWCLQDAALAVGVSLLTILAFYSGMFLDFSPVRGLWTTFGTWFQTGLEAGGHEKPNFAFGPLNFYWIWLMAKREWAALAGLAACLVFVAPSDARMRSIAIYAGGTLLAYSIIPYKTPWCLIAILWPFYLTGACAVLRLPALGVHLRKLQTTRFCRPWFVPRAGTSRSTLGTFQRWGPAVGSLGVWGVLVGAGLWWTISLNFFRYDRDEEPYAYVQTYRQLHEVTGPLLSRANSHPPFFHEYGLIFLESYYPIPWILGDFTQIGYFAEDEVPPQIDAAFVLTSENAEHAVQASLNGAYYRRPFRLRSGMDPCVAFFRFPDFQEIFGGPPDLVGTAGAEY